MTRNARPPRAARTARAVLAAGLALLAVACTGLSRLEPPEVVLTDIRSLPSTVLEQRFEVGLRLYNPNNRELPVDGLDFELALNGRRLARGATGDGFVLPRLGEATTTVTVSTSVLDLARQIAGLGKTETLTYALDGRVYLAGAFAPTLPFQKQGSVNVRP